MMHRFRGVLVALLLCTWSVYALACEHEKKTTAAAAAAAKTASVGCASKTTAVTADHSAASSRGSHGTAAAHAAACAAKASNASACKAFGASVATASAECAGKSARMASNAACCATKGATKTAVASRASKVDAVVAGGAACHADKATARAGHDCDACSELAVCDEQLTRIGVETQVVPLKNGVMIVYTASANGRAQAVQSAVARRHERLNAVVASGERAKLCPECKAMRGAMASGKLSRETVNIGGGVMTVMTSSDPKMVAKLQGMVAFSKT